MSSKLKLHVAIFNSLRTLYESGAKKEQVTSLYGTFSKTISQAPLAHKSRFIQTYVEGLNRRAAVYYKGPAIQLAEIVESIERDGILEAAITDIDIVIPWTQWSDYALENVELPEPWSFHTYTFRHTIWERLKADVFPGQSLYQIYKDTRKNFGESVDDEVRRRWRDAILMNKPKPHLMNQEIRQMWQNKPYALILTESRGQFELMDLGEWKA